MNLISEKTVKYGLDFGTSNSVISTYIGGEITSLPINAQNNTEILESAIYFGHEDILFGSEAINKYLSEKAVSEIDHGQQGITEDEFFGKNSKLKFESRLIRSFKTSLSKSGELKTRIGNIYYSVEDLISLYLQEIKTRADKISRQNIESVTVGRPVRFVGEYSDETLAEERLRSCLANAGFKEINFEYEPVAAAMRYSSKSKDLVFVFDFGGGTLDTSVVDLETKEVLACGGLPLGGDVIDFQLYDAYLAKYFGRGLKYRNNELDYPTWAVDQIIDWSEALELRNNDFINFLGSLKNRSNAPQTVEFIEYFLRHNLSYLLRKNLVDCKEKLSATTEAVFRFNTPPMDIMEKLDREVFEEKITNYVDQSIALVRDTLRDAQIEVNRIEKVVLTGGSSLIPCFQNKLRDYFGDKLVIFEPFTAVSKGLCMFDGK